jgi:hypothetical protein
MCKTFDWNMQLFSSCFFHWLIKLRKLGPSHFSCKKEFTVACGEDGLTRMCILRASRALLYSEPAGHDQDKKGLSPLTFVKHHVSEGENAGYTAVILKQQYFCN